METPPPRRKFTAEEKKQLLANLELEVQDRIRQFEAFLAHSLEAFRLRHENEVTRIPRAIRTLTIAEFADKYDGDVNKALQAITKARMEANDDTGFDPSTKKRKWQPSTDGPQETESPRAAKNARVESPWKKAAGARPRLVKTPGRVRRPQPSPGPSIRETTRSPTRTGGVVIGGFEFGGRKLQRQPSFTIFHGPSLSQHAGSQDVQPPPALEVLLSIKVPTKDGGILEFDPLLTSERDLETLEGVTDEAKLHAKEELSELNGLMAKLGKWKI